MCPDLGSRARFESTHLLILQHKPIYPNIERLIVSCPCVHHVASLMMVRKRLESDLAVYFKFQSIATRIWESLPKLQLKKQFNPFRSVLVQFAVGSSFAGFGRYKYIPSILLI